MCWRLSSSFRGHVTFCRASVRHFFVCRRSAAPSAARRPTSPSLRPYATAVRRRPGGNIRSGRNFVVCAIMLNCLSGKVCQNASYIRDPFHFRYVDIYMTEPCKWQTAKTTLYPHYFLFNLSTQAKQKRKA